jgi:hypothetical protein
MQLNLKNKWYYSFSGLVVVRGSKLKQEIKISAVLAFGAGGC